MNEKRERAGSVRPIPAGFLGLMIQKEKPFLKYDAFFGEVFRHFLTSLKKQAKLGEVESFISHECSRTSKATLLFMLGSKLRLF